MTETAEEIGGDEVAPLELFFDLVFVFAISQLSGHLLHHLTWRGGAESLVLLGAVFSVWSATSWGASLPGMGRRAEAAAIVAVMPLGLFMNAAVAGAFGERPWAFAGPFLICHLGLGVVMLLLARTPLLREHFSVQLAWLVMTSVLWAAGAWADSVARLGWWTAAAGLDLLGAWTAHRLPWRRLHSRAVQISPQHMLERSRLLLIIALGEAILTTGTALAGSQRSSWSLVAAGLAFACVALLWAMYFAGSDRLVSEHASTTDNPLGLARIAVNSQILNLASLIAVAVAAEISIANPLEQGQPAVSTLMFGGLWVFVATQAWYLRTLTGRHSRARIAALLVIPVFGLVAERLSAWLNLVLAVAVLVLLGLALLRLERGTGRRVPEHA